MLASRLSFLSQTWRYDDNTTTTFSTQSDRDIGIGVTRRGRPSHFSGTFLSVGNYLTLKLVTIFCVDRDGVLVVNVLAFHSDNPSTNPIEVNFL